MIKEVKLKKTKKTKKIKKNGKRKYIKNNIKKNIKKNDKNYENNNKLTKKLSRKIKKINKDVAKEVPILKSQDGGNTKEKFEVKKLNDIDYSQFSLSKYVNQDIDWGTCPGPPPTDCCIM